MIQDVRITSIEFIIKYFFIILNPACTWVEGDLWEYYINHNRNMANIYYMILNYF